MKRVHHCGDCAHFEACGYILKRSSKHLEISRHGQACEHYEARIKDILGDNFNLDRLRELIEAEKELKTVLERLGEFGQLFIDYVGCPRGAMGRQCAPLTEKLLSMPVITDVDGGRWRPVNEDALRVAVALLKLVEMNGFSDLEAKNAAASAEDNFSNYKIQLCYASKVFQENESILSTPQFIRYMLADSVLREAKGHIVFSERNAGKQGAIMFSARLLIAVEEDKLRK